ncbi:MAG: hypothetical protein A3J52_02635 [Omnitrophica bacterium RIFCSPHIGHO2_02_FULL_49_9]|nr:MAG: hypothetical protein A3J52_02635 [Omnitrophica bacterium RIFCSPHIGHO2_02_FULL_49_9]
MPGEETAVKVMGGFKRRVSLTLTRILSRNVIFILGCQRSGTTLCYMMLTSHPRITGLNEDESGNRYPTWRQILKNTLGGQRTCYKLIVKVGDLKNIQTWFPQAKIVWMIRHPYSVISSMKSLLIKEEGKNWIDGYGIRELDRLKPLFPEINQLDVEHLDNISKGAYVWNYKAIAIADYAKAGYKENILRYEELLKEPECAMKNVLRPIGVGWSPEVLRHEKHHAGKRYDGGTSGDKPLEINRSAFTHDLNPDEIQKINAICHTEMMKLGYAVEENKALCKKSA